MYERPRGDAATGLPLDRLQRLFENGPRGMDTVFVHR
jgi:hypothetical protein